MACEKLIHNGVCTSCGKSNFPNGWKCFYDNDVAIRGIPIRKIQFQNYVPIEDNSDFYKKRSKNVNKKRRPISRHKREIVFKKDDYICLVCGETWVHKLSLDHIVPLFHGGSDDVDNLQTLCIKCNIRKGARIRDYRIANLLVEK